MAESRSSPDRLFCALLKFWRGQRGLSQLDLANAAEVSGRHLSFLETGRARPKQEMVLRLCSTLSVPMRSQNELLRAAGFEPMFAEPSWERELAGPVGRILDRMLVQHEPYPMLVMDSLFNVIQQNAATDRLISLAFADPSALVGPLNIYRALVDPALMRPFVVDWEQTTRALLARLHRQALANPDKPAFKELVDELFDYPDVPQSWRQPDFSVPISALLPLTVARDGLRASFVSMVTVFSAPHNIALEELQIESMFPADEATEQLCARMAQAGAG